MQGLVSAYLLTSKLFFMISSVLFINGFTICMSHCCRSFLGQSLASAMFGCGLGSYVTSLLVLVSIIVEDITFPMSVCVFTIGVATLIGPTSSGFLLDALGTFLPVFLISGMLIMLGSMILPLVWWNLPRERILCL